jgi:WD40 repeat protein
MRRSVLLFVIGSTLFVSWFPCAQAQEKKKADPPIWSAQKDKFGDPLPIGAIARIGTTRFRLLESHGPQASVMSPDGKLLAVLCMGVEIEIWALPAWTRQRRITSRAVEKKNRVQFQGLAFSADSTKLATCDTNQRNIHLFDLATGKPLKKLGLGKKDQGPAGNPQLSISRDEERLFCSYFFAQRKENGGQHQEVQVWDLAKEKMTQSFQIRTDRSGTQPRHVVSADGRWLARYTMDEAAIARGGDGEGFIELWDLTTGKSARKIESEMPMQKLAFSPDGKWLAASNGQSVLRIYDAVNFKERHNIRLRRTAIQHLEFSPDGKSLYVADYTGKISRWDHISGEPKVSYDPPVKSGVRQLAFVPDGKILALGSAGVGGVAFWEVTQRKLFSPANVPTGVIDEVMFSAKGELFVASEDGSLAWWNPRTAVKLRDLKLEMDVGNLDFFIEDERVLPFAERVSRRRDVGGGIVSLSSDGEFVVAGNGNSLSFYDAKSGKLLYDDDYGLHGSQSHMSFFAGDSKVAALQGKKIRIWNARTGRDVAKFDVPLRGQEEAIRMTASANGKHFAIATADEQGQGRVVLWDADLKKVVREWVAQDRPEPMRFSPDNRWLASSGGASRGQGADGAPDHLQLTRVGSSKGDLDLRLPDPASELSELAFSPDGRQLACAVIIPVRGRDSSRIYIYEMASKKIRLELAGHQDGIIERLAYSHDSGLLASGSTDTTALIWQAGLRAHAIKPAVQDATDDELAEGLQQMAGANAKTAFQKMIKLAQMPKQSVSLFEDKIAPAKKPDTGDKTVPQWIQDLSSGRFAIRSKASAMLQKIGPSVEPELRAALPKAGDVEAKRRMEELLERLAAYEWTAEEVLHARAVEVLDAIGTPAARALLTRWASGDPAAVLTTQARRALAEPKKK